MLLFSLLNEELISKRSSSDLPDFLWFSFSDYLAFSLLKKKKKKKKAEMAKSLKVKTILTCLYIRSLGYTLDLQELIHLA